MTSTPSPCLARARPWASCEALRLYSSQPWHPEGNCDPVPRPHPSHGPLGQLPAQLRLLPELRVRSDAEKSGMDTAAEIRETELRASSSITLHATSDVLLERPLQLCSQSSRPVRGLCKTTGYYGVQQKFLSGAQQEAGSGPWRRYGYFHLERNLRTLGPLGISRPQRLAGCHPW